MPIEFLTKVIEHGETVDSLAWDVSSTQIRCRMWSGNPFNRFLTGQVFERMSIELAECDPDDAEHTYSTLVTGWVTKVSQKGSELTVEVIGSGALFSRKVPKTLLQVVDNAALFDRLNALDVADWTFGASALSQSGADVVIGSVTWPGGALPSIGADYFAYGYAERASPFQRIPVVRSTAISSGQVTLTLAYAPTPAVSGTEAGWKVYPGYDGTFETAGTKFGNAANFAGFPFAPSTNPSLVPIKKDTAGGGKK